MSKKHDMVNHPPHYKGEGLEAIEVIEGWELGYHLANAVKYIVRSSKKGREAEDLSKAMWYLTRARDEYDGPLSTLGLGPQPNFIKTAFDLPPLKAAVISDIIMAPYMREALDRAIMYLEILIQESSAAGKRA